MSYHQLFIRYIVQSRIINASPKFKLYRYNTSTGSYNLIKELPATCGYIETYGATAAEIGAKCTATDNSSDSYTVDRIELHVNTYSYEYNDETHADTKIDTVNVTTSKTESQQLKIEDKIVFTAASFVMG